MNRGWVLYDGGCCFCTGMIRRFRKTLTRYGLQTAPLQTPWVREKLNLDPHVPPSEMIVLTPCGSVHGGSDALVQIARGIWWAWPLVALSKLPGANPVLRAGYRRIAARRNCSGKACKIKHAQKQGGI
ncbi:MAG: DUF393 domain-containing protein [Verrucomicrobiota bacterium]